ncbi:hypothetical protein GX48_05917 [Paracoccidioides brasiliensis]|nr:hypothetical protein GX48_05917 [Paracoccidioides brasiliensis]
MTCIAIPVKSFFQNSFENSPLSGPKVLAWTWITYAVLSRPNKDYISSLRALFYRHRHGRHGNSARLRSRKTQLNQGHSSPNSMMVR